MSADFTVRIKEFEDGNGVRLVVIKIRHRKKKNVLKNMMIAGAEIMSEAAFLAYTWKSNIHRAWLLIVSVMGAVSVIGFCRNVRRYIRKMSRLRRDRLKLSCYLVTGAVTYFTSIHVFSEALKCNNKIWIPCLGVVASGYHLAASSVTRLGRTVLNRSPFMKCCQLLFGPALIGFAACYLNFRQHEEEWVFCLPMIASALVGNHITIAGGRRVESNNEPRWLLFKGLELFVGGCLLLVNGCVLVGYSVNKEFHPLFITFYITMIFNGIADIESSLESFQGCVEMEAPVFYCICGMIGGPIVFVSACISIRCIGHPVMLPVFMVTAGTGLALLGKSVMDLHELVPQPLFKRYCQRVLGPVVTLYGSLVTAYVGYNTGWRYSLLTVPLIPAGIYVTYQGFKRRNRPQ